MQISASILHTSASIMLAGTVVILTLAIVAALSARQVSGRWSCLGLGAAAWFFTVAAKAGLALLLLPPLARSFGGRLPLAVQAPVFGLLTGATEVAMALPLVLLTMGRWRSFESGVAFGAGFGVAEAVLIAAPLFIASLLMLLVPAAAASPDWADLRVGFTDTYRGIELVIERLAAGLVHVFAGVLIVEAARRRKWTPFIAAFVLKSAIDAVPADGQLPRWGLQAIYVAFGILSFQVLARMWRSSSEAPRLAAASTPAPSA